MKSNAVRPNPASAAPPASALASALRHPRLAGLDFLRAVAVLLVILSHSGLEFIGPVSVFDGGLGVEVFFVLSGFLITWLLLGEQDAHGRIALGTFYRRRAARLMPAMAIYLVVGALLLLVRDKPLPWGAVAASTLYVVNYYQIFTGAESHYLSHYWSLAVEEQFYLLWPVLFIVLHRSGWSLQRSLAVLIMSLWTLKGFLVLGVGVEDAYLYRALETRSDQLFIGCLLAVTLKSGGSGHALLDALAHRRWALGVVVVSILASSTLLRDSVASKYLLGYTIEPMLIALLLGLVLIEARRGGWVTRLLNAPVMVLIGQVSYGVYLYHPFIVHPIRNTVVRLTGSTPLGLVLSVAVLVVVAWASFRWIEEPLRTRLTRRSPPSGSGQTTGSPKKIGIA